MNASVEMQSKTVELLAVLDADIEHLRQCVSAMDELRALVIRRDEKGLGNLLENLRTRGQTYAANEQKRESLRNEIAGFLGLDGRQLTLSRLEVCLPGEYRAAVVERRKQLQGLVQQLKTEHLSTAMLLNDCARINALLLNSILEQCGAQPACYDASGVTKRPAGTSFVNVRL